MTQQALNSIKLYKGGNPDTIERLLYVQNKRVTDELKQHYNVTTLRELAVKLSMEQ